MSKTQEEPICPKCGKVLIRPRGATTLCPCGESVPATPQEGK